MNLKYNLQIRSGVIRIPWEEIQRSLKVDCYRVSTDREEESLHDGSSFVILESTWDRGEIWLGDCEKLVVDDCFCNRASSRGLVSWTSIINVISRGWRRADSGWLSNGSSWDFLLVICISRFVLIFSLAEIVLFSDVLSHVSGKINLWCNEVVGFVMIVSLLLDSFFHHVSQCFSLLDFMPFVFIFLSCSKSILVFWRISCSRYSHSIHAIVMVLLVICRSEKDAVSLIRSDFCSAHRCRMNQRLCSVHMIKSFISRSRRPTSKISNRSKVTCKHTFLCRVYVEGAGRRHSSRSISAEPLSKVDVIKDLRGRWRPEDVIWKSVLVEELSHSIIHLMLSMSGSCIPTSSSHATSCAAWRSKVCASNKCVAHLNLAY